MSRLLTLKKYLVVMMGCLLLGFQTSSFADSTAITSTQQIAPTIACGGNLHYNGYASACYTELWGQAAWLGKATGYVPGVPFQTTNGNSSTPNYQLVQVDGDYLVVATFEFVQNSNVPVYFWVDDWASQDVDYNGNTVTQNHRIFYSGDNPTVLNVGTGSTASMLTYYSGVVHLHAGARIYYPEIWTDCTSGVCGLMRYLADFQCKYGSCSCSDGSWQYGGTCFFVTLLHSP